MADSSESEDLTSVSDFDGESSENNDDIPSETKEHEKATSAEAQIFKPPGEYRLVLIGRTGEGKSTTGNTIFGSRVFDARAAAAAVTPACRHHKAEVEGRKLLVVDTPGLFDPRRSNEDMKMEILKFIAITAPGPHVILLVVKIGRFTEEVQATYNHVQDLLGSEGNQFTILVMTGGDDLEEDEIDIKDYLTIAPHGLKQMLYDSGSRYVVFNNRAQREKRDDQVKELLHQIDNLIATNQGRWYESKTYEDAEEALQEKEGDERVKVIQEMQAEKERLLAELKHKQEEVEGLQRVSRNRETLLQHKNRELVQTEREYETKLTHLKDDYENRLIKMRDDLRKDIENEKVNVSESWFRQKLTRAGQKLKQMLGL